MNSPTRRTVLRGGALAAGGIAAGVLGATGPAFAAGAQADPDAVDRRRFPFLEGALAPQREEVTAFDLPVTGRLPRALDGRYLRNGPNVLGLEDPRAHHWMIGAGMVHGVRLRDGRAEWYRSRWVRSADVAARLGEPYRGPQPPPVDDFAANTHVIGYRGRILACQEGGPLPYALDGDLNTVGLCDFDRTLDGSFAAHTKFDPHTGELHAVTYAIDWDHVRHIVLDRAGHVARTTRVPVADSPMMHDFGLTEKYVVLFDNPITFDAEAAAAGALVPYVWNARHPARVGLLPRAGGPTAWFDIPPFYFSHTLNAYDDGAGRVVVDFTRMPAPFEPAGRGLGGPAAAGPPSLHRWTIDPVRGVVRTERVDDRPQEFPRINEAYLGRRHRYGYTAASVELYRAYGPAVSESGIRAGNGLVKHDLLRGTTAVHRLPRGADASEPVFVPAERGASAGRAEDDGYILAYVNNPERDATDLVVLSAQDFTGKPVARVHLPVRVPLGFHGSWVPTD
ncbi:carotenoid oxygenase family protein [Embleya sp. NPDC056575]|uniref:carotenoid oxygenase family protein n=1 Tax=unclassified Embleya TaxID=2699296 RepID=UPI0036B50682